MPLQTENGEFGYSVSHIGNRILPKTTQDPGIYRQSVVVAISFFGFYGKCSIEGHLNSVMRLFLKTPLGDEFAVFCNTVTYIKILSSGICLPLQDDLNFDRA